MKMNLFLIGLLITPSLFAQSKSLGGHDMPAAVTALLAKAKAAGALVYDVNETKKDGSLKYSPYYVSSTYASGNMTFENTEITPEVLQADLEFKGQSLWMSGYKTVKASDGSTYELPLYSMKSGGTGSVSAVYDEVPHSEYFARGPQGQRWANNCGILEDGSLHCLPAVRHTQGSDYILTNPDLSRGKKMMYNGHVDIDQGVVVSVEVSGKLSKMIASGKIKMINPLAVMKAWGFKIAPDLQIYYGNTEEGTPTVDASGDLLVAPAATTAKK